MAFLLKGRRRIIRRRPFSWEATASAVTQRNSATCFNLAEIHSGQT
jgi:hypothetical protein